MNLRTKDDKIIGMDVDLATMVAEAMGVKLTLQRIDFGGLLTALDAGRIDMIVSNMTMTAERNLKAAFVGPYFTSGKALLTKRSSIAQAKGVLDLNSPQFTLVALKDSTSEEVIRAADFQRGFARLSGGALGALIATSLGILHPYLVAAILAVTIALAAARKHLSAWVDEPNAANESPGPKAP